MASSGDAHGTMIEVYPERATLDIPKMTIRSSLATTRRRRRPGRSTSCSQCHCSRNKSRAIGAREGWRAKTFGRGMRGHKPFFHVIEFWLENRLMIEVVSPEMAREYEDFLKNARTEIMGDPEAVKLMRATHVKEGVRSRIKGRPKK